MTVLMSIPSKRRLARELVLLKIVMSKMTMSMVRIYPSLVREMTSNAMGGNVTFRKALQDRLNIIRPSQTQIRDFAERLPTLTPGIKVS